MLKIFLKICVSFVIVIIVMTIYWINNKESRLRNFEDLNIISVSENTETPKRYPNHTINYFISKDKKVYVLENKELIELNKLFGAKKIITTYYDTIVLMDDGTLWNYNKENDTLKNISEMINCKNIINGGEFYAILKENGEVWLSRDITIASSEEEKIRTEYLKVNLPVKVKDVCCNNYHTGKNSCLSICLIDENNELWGYGWEFSVNEDYSLNEDYTLKLNNLCNIEKVTSKYESSLFMSNGKAYSFAVGVFKNDMAEKQRIHGLKYQYKKEDFYIDVGGTVTDVLAGSNSVGYIKTKEGKLYSTYIIKSGNIIKEIDTIDPCSKMFSTSYGLILIDDYGKIKLYRDYSIWEEWNNNLIKVRSDEILPWYDLF